MSLNSVNGAPNFSAAQQREGNGITAPGFIASAGVGALLGWGAKDLLRNRYNPADDAFMGTTRGQGIGTRMYNALYNTTSTASGTTAGTSAGVSSGRRGLPTAEEIAEKQARTQVTAQEREVTKARSALERLEGQLDREEGRLTDLQLAERPNQKLIEGKQKVVDNLRAQIETGTPGEAAVQGADGKPGKPSAREALNKAEDELNTRQDVLDEKTGVVQDKIRDLQDISSEKRKLATEATEDFEKAKGDIAGLESRLQTTKDELAKAKDRVRNLNAAEQSATEAEQTVKSLQQTQKDIQSELTSAKREVGTLERQSKQLVREAEKAEAQAGARIIANAAGKSGSAAANVAADAAKSKDITAMAKHFEKESTDFKGISKSKFEEAFKKVKGAGRWKWIVGGAAILGALYLAAKTFFGGKAQPTE